MATATFEASTGRGRPAGGALPEATGPAQLAGGQGFEDMARSAWPALVRTAHALTGHRAEAEDAVQASLLKAMSAWRRVEGQERWRQQAYLRQIVVNTCRSSWRKWGSRLYPGEPPELGQPARTAPVEDRVIVQEALARLPARQRAVLVLRYYEDLSEAEIAARLGCAPGTVKSSAARALKALRDEFSRSLAERQPPLAATRRRPGAKGRGRPSAAPGRAASSPDASVA